MISITPFVLEFGPTNFKLQLFHVYRLTAAREQEWDILSVLWIRDAFFNLEIFNRWGMSLVSKDYTDVLDIDFNEEHDCDNCGQVDCPQHPIRNN